MFLGHLYRIDRSRLMKQIFDCLSNKRSLQRGLRKLGKTLKGTTPRRSKCEKGIRFKQSTKSGRVSGRKKNYKTGRAWAENQRQQASKRMKEYWRQWKLQTKKKQRSCSVILSDKFAIKKQC